MIELHHTYWSRDLLLLECCCCLISCFSYIWVSKSEPFLWRVPLGVFPVRIATLLSLFRVANESFDDLWRKMEFLKRTTFSVTNKFYLPLIRNSLEPISLLITMWGSPWVCGNHGSLKMRIETSRIWKKLDSMFSTLIRKKHLKTIFFFTWSGQKRDLGRFAWYLKHKYISFS